MTSGFGSLLRQLRAQAGMTQEQLAERAGVGARTIRRLENGKSNPRADTVKTLAEALDIAPAEHRSLLAEVGGVPDDRPRPDSGSGGGADSGGRPDNDLDASVQQQDEPLPAPVTTPERPAARTALVEAAEQLAQQVTARWQRAEEQRPIDPHPLPVRWRPAPEHRTDHCDVRSPSVAVTTPDLSGEFTEIAEVYRRVPTGRLVVLGPAGSGKTVLATRFALNYLKTRSSTDPVPVIFSLASWVPTAGMLRDWLIERLLRDYPGLVAGAPNGSTLAAALVDNGHILPVLDGFDEMASGLHDVAMDALNSIRLPMLLTSRPEAYEEEIRSTEAVELAELTPTDLADYLPRTRGGGGATAWAPVLAELGDRENSAAGANLAEVLSTPLMVGLAGTAYSGRSGRDPAELLDTARFPTSESLEKHLLSSFVPTVYRPRPPSSEQRANPSWDPELVQRWLGHLARHLDVGKTSDIEWWKLGDSLRRWARILTVVLASALVSAVISGLSAITTTGLTGLRFDTALLQGVLVSPNVGLAFGLVYGFLVVYGRVEFQPARMQVRLSGRRSTGGGLGYSYRTRFGVGLLGGFVVGLGYGPVNALLKFLTDSSQYRLIIEVTLIDTLVSGLIFALAASLGFLVALALETPVDIKSAADPAAMLATNRTAVLREVAVLVPMFTALVAVGGELLIRFLEGPTLGELDWLPDGLIVGLVGGFTGALCYAFAFTAWGQWLIFTRLWLPLTGRLPWRVLTFLEDACDRGVLRRVGAVYQFRHASLQHHLNRSVHPLPGRNSAQRVAMSRFFLA